MTRISYAKIPLDYIDSFPISANAKWIFSQLLNRFTLSQLNSDQWSDNMGTYVKLSRETVMNKLNCCKETATKVFRELTGVGLIKEKTCGQGKANKIYVQIAPEIKWIFESNEKNRPLEDGKTVPKSTEKTDGNKTNKTILNTLDLSSSVEVKKEHAKNKKSSAKKMDRDEAFMKVTKQIDYNKLIQIYENDDKASKLVKRIANIITSVYTNNHRNYNVHGTKISYNEMQLRYELLDSDCIEYVCDSIALVSNQINNMETYLLSSLYSAIDGAKDYVEDKRTGANKKAATSHSSGYQQYPVTKSAMYYSGERHYEEGELELMIADPFEDEETEEEKEKKAIAAKAADELTDKLSEMSQAAKFDLRFNRYDELNRKLGYKMRTLLTNYTTHYCNKDVRIPLDEAITKLQNIGIDDLEEMQLKYSPIDYCFERVVNEFFVK